MRTVPGPTDSVVVVGAGLGGLSAALHLAGAGRNVTVIEREAIPGGRAGMIRDHGYFFDTGPSVLTMPELIAQPLAAVGEHLDDWLSLQRLDPAYRACFADGSTIHVRGDVDAMYEEIASPCSRRDAEGYRREVVLEDVDVALRGPILRDYLAVAPGGRHGRARVVRPVRFVTLGPRSRRRR